MVLLTACLVVRDEAPRIAATLAALEPLVDEIVVHDTGSHDDTPGIARRAGATVLRGQWRDSFAEARNVALAAAHGDWVLSVDADETATGEPAALRALLTGASEPDLAVTLHNLREDDRTSGGGYTSTAVRLFRRAGARWSGRVHERVERDGAVPGRAPRLVPATLLQLEHHGYATEQVVRTKAMRNGQLARVELDELVAAGAPAPELARAVLKVGRAAVGTGEVQRAVDAFEAVRELVPAGGTRQEATDYLARVLLGAGEAELAVVLADELEQAGADVSYCRWLRAQGLAQSNRPVAALEQLEGLTCIVDTAGRRHDPRALEALRGLCRELLEAAARDRAAHLASSRGGAR
ncbi:glycosyl transferase family 2 [Kineococcus rhizosphaerae]|uniref:Glycosyl transferase family 2 n=2 Tax=Kineococcus rhizosphaerae TaxID=559628 RepID=A0A2T0RAR2_9ACTN|nr:glycosyl transferase family 2 [Kineococcus rhizosphaerae]